MNEDELQLLITIDNPGDLPEEDTFNHLQAHNLAYWLGRRLPSWRMLDQRTECSGDDQGSMVTFGEGDWTCTLSRLTGTTNDSMRVSNRPPLQQLDKRFDIDVCTITHWKNGEVVEQKVFYDMC